MPQVEEQVSGASKPRLKWIVGGVVALAVVIGGGVALFHPKAVGSLAKIVAPPAPPSALPVKPDDWHGKIDYRALDQRFHAMMTDRSMEGLAVAVVEEGRLAFVQGYGLTSSDHGRPVDAQTVFRWASLSKTVSGTLSARLAADGVFSLNDTVGSFNTTLRLYGGAQDSLTVEQLLSQRTGLPKHAYDDRLEDDKDPAEIRQALGGVPPACPAGTCHSYQNVAYDTITEILQGRTHEAYADTVQKRLFGPLGMTTASFGLAKIESSDNWARPHGDRRVLPMSEAYYRVPAAAGVNSTIVDLATWMQAQMGLRPNVLPPAVLDEIQRPRVATARPYGRSSIGRALSNAGYGLGMRSFTFKGHRLVGHSGGIAGYRSTMIFDPATKTGIVMLWNSNANLPFRFQGEFLDRAYGEPFHDWLELKSETSDGAPAID